MSSTMFRVLIVEDEDIIRNGLCKGIAWERLGYTVSSAADAQEALAQFETLRPHVLLTDIRLAEMNGLELIRVLKRKNPRLCPVILSGYDEFAYAQEAIELGVRCYLLKPIDEEKLIATFEAIGMELRAQRDCEEDALCTPAPEDATIEKIRRYIGAMYASELTLAEIAQQVHFNPSYVSTYFKKHTGQGLFDYIQEVRVAQAQKLLRETNESIGDIAERVGYNDYRVFSKMFKKVTGETPNNYRATRRKK